MGQGNRLDTPSHLKPSPLYRSTLKRWTRTLLAIAVAGLAAPSWAETDWKASLNRTIPAIDAGYAGELGVYIQDLDSGEAYSLRADEHWYLASTVKIPVAMAVMRAVDRGELSLDTYVTLLKTDFVDGAGATNFHAPGDTVKVRFLMEQMLTYSDNTATDTLIRQVGLDTVNDLVAAITSEGMGPITTLSDVRRYAYGFLDPRAATLTSDELFAIKKARGDAARLNALAEIFGVEPADFDVGSMQAAFDAYYELPLNSGRLTVFTPLFEALASDEWLSVGSRDYLLHLLENIHTGKYRLQARLPDGVRFAHKTGTQYRRACDIGMAVASQPPVERRVLLAVCAKGSANLAATERAIRAVGQAAAESGIFSAQAGGDMAGTEAQARR